MLDSLSLPPSLHLVKETKSISKGVQGVHVRFLECGHWIDILVLAVYTAQFSEQKACDYQKDKRQTVMRARGSMYEETVGSKPGPLDTGK